MIMMMVLIHKNKNIPINNFRIRILNVQPNTLVAVIIPKLLEQLIQIITRHVCNHTKLMLIRQIKDL